VTDNIVLCILALLCNGGADTYSQVGHIERYNMVRGPEHSKYLYCNPHKTEHYNKNSLNLSY
jgi:hypothetical protein